MDFADTNGEAPCDVEAVPRFWQDAHALGKSMRTLVPPKRLIRGNNILIARYGFGDASGEGFGAAWEGSDGRVRYRFGVWNEDTNTGMSSNFRELTNLVETVETMEENGELDGVELFLFTDNDVAEGTFYKGTSSSKPLFELILRLKEIEVNNLLRLHLIHIAGTRMILQGADGLSRGSLAEGVMTGKCMQSFVPLGKSAVHAEPALLEWIKGWWGTKSRQNIEVMKPEDWFLKGHDVIGFVKNCDGIDVPHISSGTYIWSPPPCAAETVVEELRKARQKRHQSNYIFVCPKVLKRRWLGQVYKAADLVIEIKAGRGYWPHSQHESLILALFFPFLGYRPWQLRHTATIRKVDSKMRELLKLPEAAEGNFLRKFCLWQETLASLQEGMVWKVLQGTSGFQILCGKARK